MKRVKWQIILSAVLILLSAFLYAVEYDIFGGATNILNNLLANIAFIPIQVLLVTLVISGLLSAREKSAMLNKLNMVVGAFFSEAGTELLKSFSGLDTELEKLQRHLIVARDWRQRDFVKLKSQIKSQQCRVDIGKADLEKMRVFLLAKRPFLLRLLENPNLLEHETFTELLQAVFHLTEELAQRPTFTALPEKDLEHLAGDIKRAYSLLLLEWCAYMEHLSKHYPYLFSLAMRTNPFDAHASVIIT